MSVFDNCVCLNLFIGIEFLFYCVFYIVWENGVVMGKEFKISLKIEMKEC